MRTFNVGETVVVPRFERGEIVGHVTGTVTDHHPASAYYLVRVQDKHVGLYPHEMMRPGEPRHRADAPADSGATAPGPRTYPKHATPDPTRPYRDPWAGNPDTDKAWGKNR